MLIENPIGRRRKKRRSKSGGTMRKRRSTKSRRRGGARKKRRNPTSKAKRSAAARKGAKTRKRNAAKRSRSAKKAAATRKRNSRTKRRKNPTRSRSRTKSRKRRSSGRSRRRSRLSVRSITSSLRPRTAANTLMDSMVVAAGWGAANALRNVQTQAGLDGLLDRLPPGLGRTMGELLTRVVNVAVVQQVAGFIGVSKSAKSKLKLGGIANLGVKTLSAASAYAGAPGAAVAAHLSDYQIVGGAGASAMSPYGYAPAQAEGLDGYLTAGGAPVMPPVVDASQSSPAFLGY